MIKIKQAIVVEGKYDKIKLSSLVDATIIETGGFSIFKDREKMALLRLLADRVGLVVLTDSDVAGFRIRRYLGGCIDKSKIHNAYIPDVLGKERRKAKPSAEGKLGVEGVSAKLVLEALERAGVFADTAVESPRPITKQDFIAHGLSGGVESVRKRAALLKALDLPEYLTTNAMVEVLNTLMSYEEFCRRVEELAAEE